MIPVDADGLQEVLPRNGAPATWRPVYFFFYFSPLGPAGARIFMWHESSHILIRQNHAIVLAKGRMS